MKKVVIVQARMTSSRLPGKVMLKLGDHSVLGCVLLRCLQIRDVDEICCAIPTENCHDVLEDESRRYGCSVFRGDEKDVLKRYYDAACFTNASVIMRVTSDCPLINTDVCSLVLEQHIEKKSIFSCNNAPPSWPHGYDCEVFDFKALKLAYENAKLSEEREHVTPWIRKNFPILNVSNPLGNQYSTRLTLDTLEDYMHLNKIISENAPHS